MKNMRQTFLVLLGAVSLATMAGLAQTASTNATKPGDKLASLFPDTVLAKGKGFEVKRSQLDDEVIKIKAQYAASGRTLPPDQADMMEKNILNGLIQMELLHLRATDADKAKGKEQFEKALQAVKDEQKLTDAELDEKLAPQLRLQHISKEQWQKQQMDQTTLEATIERELKVSISDEDVKKFYDDNPSKFEQPEMVRAAHVLLATQDLKTKTDLPEAQKAAKRKLAEDVLKRARAGEDFAKLAKEYSDDDGSKEKGGEYTFPRGQMMPEFEVAAFALETNQISDIVTTQYGYHIIKLYEKIPAKKVELTKVAARVKEALAQQAVQKQFPQYMAGLKKEANVEILDEKLKLPETSNLGALPTAGQPSTKPANKP
ncbi:PpiC-type peptidyl-prolyl cis-trans isomerase [Verrucomicrobia bacterium]|nr:PpiC-type peptidyl-prolyl cis-trans isomerase [Verrucomicrobiota bacterium]